jgi:hypothetical protein
MITNKIYRIFTFLINTFKWMRILKIRKMMSSLMKMIFLDKLTIIWQNHQQQHQQSRAKAREVEIKHLCSRPSIMTRAKRRNMMTSKSLDETLRLSFQPSTLSIWLKEPKWSEIIKLRKLLDKVLSEKSSRGAIYILDKR